VGHFLHVNELLHGNWVLEGNSNLVLPQNKQSSKEKIVFFINYIQKRNQENHRNILWESKSANNNVENKRKRVKSHFTLRNMNRIQTITTHHTLVNIQALYRGIIQ
jgi:hypothetical protein